MGVSLRLYKPLDGISSYSFVFRGFRERGRLCGVKPKPLVTSEYSEGAQEVQPRTIEKARGRVAI